MTDSFARRTGSNSSNRGDNHGDRSREGDHPQGSSRSLRPDQIATGSHHQETGSQYVNRRQNELMNHPSNPGGNHTDKTAWAITQAAEELRRMNNGRFLTYMYERASRLPNLNLTGSDAIPSRLDNVSSSHNALDLTANRTNDNRSTLGDNRIQDYSKIKDNSLGEALTAFNIQRKSKVAGYSMDERIHMEKIYRSLKVYIDSKASRAFVQPRSFVAEAETRPPQNPQDAIKKAMNDLHDGSENSSFKSSLFSFYYDQFQEDINS